MYIQELKLENVKLLRDLRICFQQNGKPRLWTVLVGEIGLCKTTILQAIALAANGPDRSNQLAEVASLPDRRREKLTTSIEAKFSFGELHSCRRKYPRLPQGAHNGMTLCSRLQIEPGWSVFSGSSTFVEPSNAQSSGKIDPLKIARGENFPHWFVAGYGVERSLPQPQLTTNLKDHILQRVGSLFGQGRMVGTGFADLFENKDSVLQFSQRLQEVVLKKLLPRISNIELRGRGGVKTAAHLIESNRFSFRAGRSDVRVPATWLSQGYQGLIAWVADLIGQQFWDSNSTPELSEMEGLVLVDELDLYLHPTWQLVLVRALKGIFPRLQFIVTTHSPMLLPGFDRDEIVMLSQDEDGNVIAQEAEFSPMLMTGSEIYRAFFGVEGLYPSEAGEKLQRYGFISSNPRRSDEDEQEMDQLRGELKAVGVDPGWDPVRREAL